MTDSTQEKKEFIRLLSAYAPTSRNKASYDEHVSKFAKRLGVDEIKIDNSLLEKLFEKFILNPKPIIISGSAGDGKTYLLRKLFFEMGGESKYWSEYIPQLQFEGRNITFIKDFTEIEKEDKLKTLINLYKSIYEKSDELYIIASNDGILTDTLRYALPQYPYLEKLLNLIEDSIDNPKKDEKLILLDLSQTSSSKNFELLLKDILIACDKYESDCPSLYDDKIFCPIHANIEMLKKEHIQKQLISIIRICDLNYQHITLRKLFMLISNMILGYREKTKVFNSCAKGIEYFKNSSHNRAEASFYYNIFGDNLPKSKQEESPFKELRELRIGYETSNYIDDFILYGDIDNKELYHKEIDNIFFDFEIFLKKRADYLEDGEMKIIKDFLVLLRRHLFFNYRHKIQWGNITITNQDLIAYKHAHKFYDKVISPLYNGNKVSNTVYKELVLGLNRVFLGELLSKAGNTRLFIATSLTGTDSKLSSEIIEDIGFNKRGSNQGVELQLLRGFDDEYCKVILNIIYSGEIISSLELDLHMFEFLERISDGILPTSFSVEYYERILSFKSQIVNYFLKNRDSDESFFRLFTLNDKEGTLQFNEILVEEGNYVNEG